MFLLRLTRLRGGRERKIEEVMQGFEGQDVTAARRVEIEKEARHAVVSGDRKR